MKSFPRAAAAVAGLAAVVGVFNARAEEAKPLRPPSETVAAKIVATTRPRPSTIGPPELPCRTRPRSAVIGRRTGPLP